MAKKCMKIASHKRGGKNVKQHVRCIEVAGKEGESSKLPKGSGGGGMPPDFERNYNEAVNKGYLKKGMSFDEVKGAAGYHSDFGEITEFNTKIKDDSLEISFKTKDIESRMFIKKDSIYFDYFAKSPESKISGAGEKTIDAMRKNGKKIGKKKIELYAAVSAYGKPANGYYTWPRLGFESKHKSLLGQFNDYPGSKFKGVGTFKELLSTEAGRQYWKSEGKYAPNHFYEMELSI